MSADSPVALSQWALCLATCNHLCRSPGNLALPEKLPVSGRAADAPEKAQMPRPYCGRCDYVIWALTAILRSALITPRSHVYQKVSRHYPPRFASVSQAGAAPKAQCANAVDVRKSEGSAAELPLKLKKICFSHLLLVCDGRFRRDRESHVQKVEVLQPGKAHGPPCLPSLTRSETQ
jgi:hypothetical protein